MPPDATPEDPTAARAAGRPAARHVASRGAPRAARPSAFVDWLADARAVVVAGAPADPARPPRLALREPLGLRGAGPACWPARGRRVTRRRARPTSASATPTGSATGRASPAGTRWPTRCASSASGGRCVVMQPTAGCGSWATCPSTSPPAAADVRAHPGLFRARRGRGRAPGRLHGRRPALGQPDLRLARPCARRATAGGSSACAARAIWLTCVTHRPLPGLRRLVGRAAAGARTARGRALAPGAQGRGGARRRAAALRTAAAGGRGPRRDHRAGPPR